MKAPHNLQGSKVSISLYPMIPNDSHPWSPNLQGPGRPETRHAFFSQGARSNTLASEHALWITFYMGAGSLARAGGWLDLAGGTLGLEPGDEGCFLA